MNYEGMTDFDINKAVTVALGVEVTEGEFLKYQDANKPRVPAKQDCPVHIWVDYCNNPAHAWPIILGNKISIEFRDHKSLNPIAKRFGSNSHNIADKNPLRAAMIVYLMMNEDKK